MNWLLLSWALTTSFLPANVQAVFTPLGNSTVIATPGSFSAEIELSAEAYNHLRVWGSVETFAFFNAAVVRFNPFEADYIVGAALFSKGIEAGVKLECWHGVQCDQPRAWYGTMSTAIYLKLSGHS